MIFDHIQGERFCSVADFIYQPSIKTEFKDYYIQVNTFELNKMNKENI